MARWRWRSTKWSEESLAAQAWERLRHLTADLAGKRAKMSSMTSSGSTGAMGFVRRAVQPEAAGELWEEARQMNS